MDWQTRLITVYLKTCELWEQGISATVTRYSNNSTQDLSDEEVMTIFLNGVIVGRTTIKSIYNFTADYLSLWFPNLGSYEAYIKRLNRVSNAFIPYLEMLLDPIFKGSETKRKLIDSFPIVMAKAKRSNKAKVAPELSDKGYCDSKDMYYYGVKIHIMGLDRDGAIPVPLYIGLTPASNHDITAFKQVVPELENCDVFADKAYSNGDENKYYKTQKNVSVATPVKLKKGQKKLESADKIYSELVSSIRQPIESLFNWINEKTGIQAASKVRSSNGLMVHTFGRLAAGIFMMLNF